MQLVDPAGFSSFFFFRGDGCVWRRKVICTRWKSKIRWEHWRRRRRRIRRRLLYRSITAAWPDSRRTGRWIDACSSGNSTWGKKEGLIDDKRREEKREEKSGVDWVDELTRHVKLVGQTGSFTLGVACVTGVASGSVARDALENQTRLANDHSRTHVVLQYVPLLMTTIKQTRKKQNMLQKNQLTNQLAASS